MNIKIEIIPHEQQRYSTAGDWFYEPTGDLTIRVSHLPCWRAEMLIAVHELIEVLLCKHRHITQEQVDHFDNEYESKRKSGDDSEPGDDPAAPYVEEHCFATGIERLLATELGVSWRKYEDELNKLP